MTFLHLSLNNLIGNIPLEIGNLSKLTKLWLSSNQLAGGIPAEFGNLDNLRELTLSSNQLSGCYDENLIKLCSCLSASYNNSNSGISNYNNFDAPWEDFCDFGAGICPQVWPGDFNYDGTASEADFLIWGLATAVYTGNEPIRPDATTDWLPQDCPDWSYEVEGVNGKHQDGDGNSIIDEADIDVLLTNFGETHNLASTASVAGTFSGFRLERRSGTQVYDLYLDDLAGGPALAHGISGVFNLNYGFNDSISMNTVNSSLEPDTTLQVFYPEQRKLHFAMTRTDGLNKECIGPIASFIVISDDLPTGGPRIDVRQGLLVEASGDMSRIGEMTLYDDYDPFALSSDFTISTAVNHAQCTTPGTATIIISGGTPPYSYYWNTGDTNASLTNLTPGNYSLTVTDANTLTETLDITVDGIYLPVYDQSGNLLDCSFSDCPTLLNLNNTISSGNYQANSAMYIEGSINPGNNVSSKAGNLIQIAPGTNIEPGATLNIKIDACGGN